MINKIKISGVASYRDEGVTIEPEKINYLFGANGVGKTTISRVISTPQDEKHKDCTVSWSNDKPLDAFVYNRDFIEDTFASQMIGVFTLGAAEKSILEDIQTKNAERSRIQDELTSLNNTLSTKQEEQNNKKDQFKEVCWKQKGKYESDFRPALKGSMNSKKSFCDKVIEEDKNNKATLLLLEKLQQKAKALFSQTASKVELIVVPDVSKLSQILSNPIWQKIVVGSSDIGIAALIERLNNSDWVEQGRKYLDDIEESCPFCQQSLPHDFKDRLEQYFGGEFAKDKSLIEDLIHQHGIQCKEILTPLESLSEEQKFFFEDDFEQLVRALRQKFEDNHRRLKEKVEKPSEQIEPDDIQDLWKKVLEALSSANQKILKHNTRIDNKQHEKGKLISEVWRFILEELKDSLATYKKEDSDLDKAIASLNTQIGAKQKSLDELNSEINKLEKGTVSVRPTVDAINKILKYYGFSGFQLAVDKNEEDKYRLIRNGEIDDEIHRTLSEGEKSFITFLYFYHLIKGSPTSSGTLTDRIVVFDDPVSSLDSNVLFIVSTLVREIIKEVRKDNNQFKQVFVLTHNVYFHKEISYKPEGKYEFWVIRKPNGKTIIRNCEKKNPINSTYESLWLEVKADDVSLPNSSVSLPNSMRRILEYFFKFFGDTKLNELPQKFDGNDQMLVKALLSWAHASSHINIEDIDFALDDSGVEKQKKVFKAIFEKSGHIDHYKMMMGEGDNSSST